LIKETETKCECGLRKGHAREREGEGEIQFGREFAIYNVCMGVHY
jgi:hypothetical protein